jgi:threonine dehydrogenase-like Zn-dependent dehydrogenase
MDELAVDIAGIGATVVFVGASAAPFAMTSMALIQRELRLLGSRGFTRRDVAEVIDLRATGALRLDHLLTDVRPFDAAAAAFETIGAGERLRTIIEPWNVYDDVEARVNGEAA